MIFKLRLAVGLAFVFAAACACAQNESNAPYFALRKAYASADADAAARAYAERAVYVELFEGLPPQAYSGRNRLRELFAMFIDQVRDGDKKTNIDLNFRLLAREPRTGGSVDTGFYRLTATDAQGVESFRSYGRFAVSIERGEFVLDANSAATRAEFESAVGPVMFASDEERLDPEYYDALTGRYAGDDGCEVLVTRSAWRLYALDDCDLRWRGLDRVSGTRWRGGTTVIDAEGKTDYRFEVRAETGASRETEGGSMSMRIENAAAAPRNLAKRPGYRRERASFVSRGTELRGELLFPAEASNERRPAVVLVHGSGEQDRYGYASIMRVLAERFLRSGFIVFSYDKRGVGQSRGDLSSAGFDTLGEDAGAALAMLRARPETMPDNVGIAGSSQAGWVTAAALRGGASPDFVVLVGAAGAALTVEEQNLYNTETRMRCAGIPETEIALALDQQRAFFAARRDASAADALASITRAASERRVLADWLFPERVATGGPKQWYDVLDPDFDPRPIWAAYRGRSFFLFSEFDDSTPTGTAVARLRETAAAGARRIETLPGAQHIGMRAASICDGDVARADAFHPDFFSVLDGWLAEIAGDARS